MRCRSGRPWVLFVGGASRGRQIAPAQWTGASDSSTPSGRPKSPLACTPDEKRPLGIIPKVPGYPADKEDIPVCAQRERSSSPITTVPSTMLFLRHTLRERLFPPIAAALLLALAQPAIAGKAATTTTVATPTITSL